MVDIDGASRQHSWDNHGQGEIGAPNTTRLLERLLDLDLEADGSPDSASASASGSASTGRGAPALSLVAHIGDISYATGALALWDSFLAQVSDVSGRVAYMTAIGNHEMGWDNSFVPGSDSQGECGVPYATFFPFAGQPAQAGASQQPWYSFEHGMAHFTVMSTEHDFGQGSPQLSFLARDLANVDRAVTPWLVLLGHRPMYVSSTWIGDHDGVAFVLQKELEPLLLKSGVDLAFWGHHHSYQRSCAGLAKGACNSPGGIQHFVVGSGGFAFSKVAKHKDPLFDVANNTTYGVATVDFLNASLATVNFWSSASHSSESANLTSVDQVQVSRRLRVP